MGNATKDFWDDKWRSHQLFVIEDYNFNEFKAVLDRIEKNHILKGKNILDLGCGRGETAVYLAKKGANVFAVDSSGESVAFANKLAEHNNVKINASVCDAFDIDKLDIKFDIVVGKFILHHIEPFNDFTAVLKEAVSDGGYGIFYENNARNKLLMLSRRRLTGKFGIPKYGDAEEYPFSPKEIKMLKKNFSKVRLSCPKFLFFELLAVYLFKGRKRAVKFFAAIDRFIYKLRFLNRYSYLQIIEIQVPKARITDEAAAALRIATKAHKSQKDKSGEEYIRHPVAVSGYCKTERGRIAALLHDVIEDTAVTAADLSSAGISGDVIEAVRCLTKGEDETLSDYLLRVSQNDIATEVKFADMRHNSDKSRWPADRQQEAERNYQKYFSRAEDFIRLAGKARAKSLMSDETYEVFKTAFGD